MSNGPLSRPTWIRLILTAALAAAVSVAAPAGGFAPPGPVAHAALGGLTDFEIDSNTVTDGGGIDWVEAFANGDVSVSNDVNYTGAAVVQSDVGDANTEPSWLVNCPKSKDTIFKASASIDDPDWSDDHDTGSVTPKNDICQSYFSYEVTGSGEIVAYIAFTRRVFNGDGSYYFILSRGPDPDVRVDGDIVIEIDYGSQGIATNVATATWSGSPTPVLGDLTTIAIDDPNVELSPVQYFAEAAINLTELGLAPNVFEFPDQQACEAFGYGRAISRTGNSATATLKDDGEPVELDFNVCGTIIVEKALTDAVPGASEFPFSINLPEAGLLDAPTGVLRVPGGDTMSAPVVWTNVPPRDDENATYTITEDLSGALGTAWNLESIVCVNDRGTPADPSDDVIADGIVGGDTSEPFTVFTEETVTCTITNSPAPATINVDKDADGADGTWPVDLTGGSTGQVMVTDDGTIDFSTAGTFATFGNVDAGTYTLTEGAEADGGAFRPTGWSCDIGGVITEAAGASIGINIGPGEVANCTITNEAVPPPNVRVVKSAAPVLFDETATTDPITYTVLVANDGNEPFTITDLSDVVSLNGVWAPVFDLDAAVVGDEAGLTGATFESNSCGSLIGQVVNAQSTLSCTFDVSYIDRNAGDVIDDTVTATVVDEFGRPAQASDDAQVAVADVAPVLTVSKDNVAVGGVVDLVAPGGEATYAITVTNGPNAIEAVTITGVVDTMSSATDGTFSSVLGDLAATDATVTATTCGALIGTELEPGESVGCEFTVDTTAIADLAQNDTVTNTVVVTAEDDDGTEVSDDDAATRDVLGEPPAMTVFKTDGGATADEPGQEITYTIAITNQSTTEQITITTITDTIAFLADGGTSPGDLQDRGVIVIDGDGVDASGLTDGVEYRATTCNEVIGVTLGVAGSMSPSDTVLCTVTLFLPGDAGDRYDDTVLVTAVDETGDAVEDRDDEQTPIVDVVPAISIVKDVSPGALPETGGQAQFTLTITNDSVSTDPLTLTDLSDSDFGDLFGSPDGVDSSDCDTLAGTLLNPGDATTCSFTATLSGNAGTSHFNTASVTGVDDDGNSVSDNDSASVEFTDVIPEITVTKTADPTTVPETGGEVTFAFVVENVSAERVTTTTLVDDEFGNLVGLAGSTCVVGVALAPSDGIAGSGPDTYSCTLTTDLAQQEAETEHVNVVTATAVDDEGNTATSTDDATVDFELVPPTVEITKTDNDATVAEPGGDVVYTLGITNTSVEEVTITSLTDVITYTDPSMVITVDLITPEAPVSNSSCAEVSLAPGETYTCSFTVALEGNVQIVTDQASVEVADNDGQTASAAANESTPITDVRPSIGIVKAATPTEINVGDTVTYEFVITNGSTIESLTLLTLDDDKFGDILAECDLDGFVLAPDDGVAGGPDEATCRIDRVLTEAPGSIHVNTATVTGADDETLANLDLPVEEQDPALIPVTASDDASVLTLAPDVTVDKALVAAPGYDPATGIWTIAYEITVNNDGPGVATYDLDDELRFGAGVIVGSVSVETLDGDEPNPAFDGGTGEEGGDTALVTGANIDGAVDGPVTETYTVRVTATIPTPVVDAGECDPDGAAAGGFLNSVRLTTNGEQGPRDFACAPFATLTLVKDLVNDDGGEGTLADFVLSASSGESVYLEGTGTVTAAVPGGTYSLAEEQLVDGYAAGAWSCSGGTVVGSTVTLPDASQATCTIVNNDEPVDLVLTKSDSVDTVVAGGAPFEYTISVSNAGTRAIDADEPVTVTDELPAPLQWVSFPDSCTQAGQTLTCDIDPAALPPGGEPVVIVTEVSAPAGAASGVYVNRASVTTEDDPASDAPCPAEEDNNVDCEQTPVDRQGAISIVKTDDVAAGETVQAGDTFSYQLVVTNTGVSTLLPGTSVDDDLPAELVLVSVSGGAGWSCNDADPVTCAYGPALAPGEVAPPITIEVSVAASAAGTAIDNVAIATGSVDAGEPVTDSDDEATPLVANADLAVVKTASVAQVGAGSGFSWELVVTNNGPGTARDVVVSDLVVTGDMTVTGVSSSFFECAREGNAVTCARASMAPGASGTVTIDVTVASGAATGTLDNVGTVEASTPDPNLTNNRDEASVPVIAQAPPTVPEPPPIDLPETGSRGVGSVLQLALWTVLIGAGAVLTTRRRSRSTDTQI